MIGIVGQGVVGSAHTRWFTEAGCEVAVADRQGKAPELTVNPERLVYKCKSASELALFCRDNPLFEKIYFLCLPTPMDKIGAAYTGIVFEVLEELHALDPLAIKVVKSTVPPGSVKRWNEFYGNKVVFCPEFLTEAHPLEDLQYLSEIILGGPSDKTAKVKTFFSKFFPEIDVYETDSTTAEMVKYMTNVHLATRVILSCELAEICEALGIDYDHAMTLASFDDRLGGSHMRVPGPDGHRGARGHCFPKDLRALAVRAREVNCNPMLLDALWQKNLSIVKPEDRDWEKMKGRAVL